MIGKKSRSKNSINMKIAIVLGTRPEIIKLSSTVDELQKRGVDFFIIHTNQHYSQEMDSIFFKELGLPQPKYNLGIGSASHGEQTGKMLIAIEKVLDSENPDVVIVQGDTNTVVAGALAAAKLHIAVAHVEAGLRSYDRNMPEEINRVIADHCADYLFAPTKGAAKILKREGIESEKIFVTGNTIVDALNLHSKIVDENKELLGKNNVMPGGYFLVTCHRQENVDSKEKFSNILKALDDICKEYNISAIYPIHPRAKKMIAEYNLQVPSGVKVIDPVGYLDFLFLEKNAKIILTDSGGVQEEACILKVPCVTLRENTERPETVEAGGNVLAGTNPKDILKAVSYMLLVPRRWNNPFGDGHSGERIVNILCK